jgi:hypothetical protein
LSRFLGPDLAPSAIAQGVILEAMTMIDATSPANLSDLARSVFKGLAFDYYRGGLNLSDVALLEIPLFRSPPEIVLNGWLDALLHLHSYAEAYEDDEARQLFASNLQFLASALERFQDPQSGLSRYSNLCPYRIRIETGGNTSLPLTAFYRARIPELDNLAFDLAEIGGLSHSNYDNQIIRQTSTGVEAWVSCSQEYDTYIVSLDGPFKVELETGTYDPYRSTPSSGGERVQLSSSFVDGYHVVDLTSARDRLFCGYPTNFSKLDENYYHTYHIVALACLLASDAVPDEIAPILGHLLNRWFEAAAKTTSEKGLVFTAYQKVLDGVVKNGTHLPSAQWDDLLRLAQEQSS